VLLRTLEIGTRSLEPVEIARADLYISTQLDATLSTEAPKVQSMIRAGYEAAGKALSHWDSSRIPFC
jgi:hypothetical protein